MRRDFTDGGFLVRVRGDAESVARHLEADANRAIPGALIEVHSVQDIFEAQFFPFTIMYSISSVIGMIALAMAASGIFGFVSFLATQRTKEIGIRMSLGATRSNVRLLIVHQVMSTAWGLFVGTIVALGVSRIFASSIFVMNRALDSVAYGGAIGVVTIAATIAAFVPSERASSLDPVATLRNG